MSLKITNRLTQKQRELLVKLEYVGKWDITVEEAAKLIDELVVERKLSYGEIRDINNGYYDLPSDVFNEERE